MNTIALVTFWLTAGFSVVQATLVALFVRRMRRVSSSLVNPDLLPVSATEKNSDRSNVGIVLCVRGVDPSLEDCLHALLAQDYPARRIFVVGDDDHDPGIEFCRQVAKDFPGQIELMINSEILKTCGLKCSNLVFAMQRLGVDCEFFVLVDADTVPPENWLRSMLEPFSDPDVCVATGVRWFDVEGKKMGTWVRYIWNTAAIVQMVCYRIPWGGSLAIRTSFLREGEVLESWSRGFCEDTMLQSLVKRFGGQVEVVPEGIIRNREETSLGRCLPWIRRQLLTARLHHPKWPLVLGHGVLTGTLSFLPLVGVVVSAALGMTEAAFWYGSAYLLLQLSNLGMLFWIEDPVRKRSGNRSTFSRSPAMFLTSVLVTQVCYPLAMIQAMIARRVEWRQIWYRIRGKRIEMEHYQQYQQLPIKQSL